MSIKINTTEQKEVSSTSANKAMQSLSKSNIVEEKKEEKIVLNKDFVTKIQTEFDLTLDEAEKLLKQNKGDLEKTLIFILNSE